MQLELVDGARAFLDETTAYRAADPLRTNVLGSVATSVAEGVASYGESFWWVLRDGDRVVGAAMRTSPQALSLGPMPDEGASLLAARVARVDDAFPAVNGPRDLVASFLSAYAASGSPLSDRVVTTEDVHVLYAIDEVRAVEVPGASEVASMAEFDLVERWFGAFDEEVDGIRHARSEDDRSMLAALVADGRLRWWRDDGRIVSMAGHAIPVGAPGATITRIGPVYTPLQARRRGYGGAVTGALAAELLARGSKVMLFADAANPTSNHVYQDLGFVAVDEMVRAFLGPQATHH